MNTSISRRQFLKASGLAAAGACAAGLLTGCGGSSSGSASGAASSGSGSSYTILYDSQPATLNYLTTGTDLEMVVGANCVDTLVEYDNKGVMREGLATSWDWDINTLTWTFHLREENWVDCNGEVVAPVTAQDFVDALKYVLTPDYAASNVGLVTAYIAGADDYYSYHVYLNNANTGVVDDDGTTYTVDGSGVVTVTAPDSDPATYAPVDFDAVGVTAVDDHTLTYTLTYDFPGFLSLLCYLPYEPAYGPLLEETGDQFATSAETTGTDLEMVVGANCVDTLVEYDNKGVMREGLATSWDWDINTLTWTFHLREENWVDCNGEVVAPVTAQDFVDALKYVLTPDYAASNVGLVTAYIAGADDYYSYHVYLNNANTGVVDDDGTTYTVDGSGVVTVTAPDSDPATYAPVDFDAVGVTAVDDHTLTYTLTYDFPGFLSLLCYLPYEPAYGPLLEETGDQFATSAETTYSCGAFYLAAYESLETWVMKKNPENYDADNVFIDTISRIYNAEASVNGPEMIKRGEIDEATIGSDILDSWLSDDTTKDMVSMDRPNTNYTYFYMFNFMPFSHEFSNWSVEGMDAEYEPENWAKAINNTNFRKSFLYGINNSVTLAVKAPEGYDNYKLNTITPPSFCANADGVDYLKCGDLANITEFFDEAKAKEYRDAAIPELTAAGVTFPIKVQMPYNPSSTDWDKQCQVFKQQLEGVLNDGFDFIDIIITAGPSDSFLSSVRRNGKFAFLQCNWGADYSDPQTETDPFYQAEGARGSRYAFLRTGVEDGFITGDTADAVMNYMKAIEEAVKITDDINARYDAFANAEASLINNALVVPLGMSIPAYIATRLNYWEGQYASTGFSNKRLKGIHVLDHYISMSEYEANRDAR